MYYELHLGRQLIRIQKDEPSLVAFAPSHIAFASPHLARFYPPLGRLCPFLVGLSEIVAGYCNAQSPTITLSRNIHKTTHHKTPLYILY